MELIIEVLKHSIMISGFVFVMMLLIEYINVQTQGYWISFLHQKPIVQYLIAAALGAFPGCLGAFTVVAMYSHGVVSLGALVAAMIATSGDETFVMLAMIPQTAILIMLATFVVGVIAGYITDKLFPGLKLYKKSQKFHLHKEERCDCLTKGNIFVHMKDPSIHRILLLVILVMILAGYVSGFIAGDLMMALKVTIIAAVVFLLFVVITVPEHFLLEHLWNHIVKKHLPKIFFWTFGALLLIHLLMHYFDLESWINSNYYLVLLIAVLVGLIPESGPHLVFVTLFFEGTIPFSILLASSIVQDGHGMIPMLAESKRGFLLVKFINLVFGLVIGLILLYFRL